MGYLKLKPCVENALPAYKADGDIDECKGLLSGHPLFVSRLS